MRAQVKQVNAFVWVSERETVDGASITMLSDEGELFDWMLNEPNGAISDFSRTPAPFDQALQQAEEALAKRDAWFAELGYNPNT